MYKVLTQSCVWIPLKDSNRLASKLWIPVSETEKANEKFPAILEYLPYRRNDRTSRRDEKRHPWMCSHGYVVIRVDMRGSGDSDGLYFGEYEPQEQDDCLEVIDWIRKQPWSSGNVGMVGKSWGGFNGLQVAARNPEGLKAIISVYSVDDRYDDNCHYKGGCLVPEQMLSWSCAMLTWNMSPPDPAFVGAKWRDMWLERLEKAGEPWVNTWLSHQTRDEFWKHASVCEDYSKIKCAVYLMGGWFDCYHNAVFRMAEHLSCDWRALVGPWPHEFPDEAIPSPNIAYLPESLRFWDYHLKGIENGLDKEPRFRLYLGESVPVSPKLKTWPGRWVAEDKWPSKNVSMKRFELTYTGRLRQGTDTVQPTEKSVLIPSFFACGSAGGTMIPFNGPAHLAQNQASDDGLSRCWHGDVLVDAIDILGAPSIQLEISSDQKLATICARLVDVFPDGRATLITKGVLNLTHRYGHTMNDIKPLNPGERYVIEMNLDTIGYTVRPGHQLRLALSQSYWPYCIWPPPSTPILQLHFISPPVLALPLRQRSKDIDLRDELFSNLGQPIVNTHALPVKELRKPSFQRHITHDVQTQSYKKTLKLDDGEFQRLDNNIIWGVSVNEEYDITESEPLSARVTIETNTRVARKESGTGQKEELFATFVNTKSSFHADENNFYTDCIAKAWLGDEVVFEKQWKKTFPRFHV
ncbi:uncharacterized protein LOC114525526 [Dendronephthya gigantea]|uniref:uncharacterized protein LOC114525526 n=1 Tax=Dendronephthya gigantea TaxID=151771 RepID=UPI0010696867|nr:uncharacterized protein LOC114525526 [Dendronephthya gigantea]